MAHRESRENGGGGNLNKGPKVSLASQSNGENLGRLLLLPNSMFQFIQVLWAKYKANPQEVSEIEWDRLEGNLDIVKKCSNEDKERFFRKKEKYMGLLKNPVVGVVKKKVSIDNIRVAKGVSVKDFKKMIEVTTNSSLIETEIVGVKKRIADVKKHLTLGKDDIEEFIAIIKRSRSGSQPWCQELVSDFEADLSRINT